MALIDAREIKPKAYTTIRQARNNRFKKGAAERFSTGVRGHNGACISARVVSLPTNWKKDLYVASISVYRKPRHFFGAFVAWMLPGASSLLKSDK
ncbi:MAG: hypothetical protein HGB32_09655 [Geobacteraceae bacterium]|nr:hypothetical protein [Geobacteraceae bacterium]NTW80399.1 hypothetical protein [Geobacteraceae bacterium]